MYIFPLFFTFIGFTISFFFGKLIGIFGATIITTFFVFLAMIISFFLFFEVGLNTNPTYFKYFNWIRTDTMDIEWGFQYDSLTVSMLLVVTIVSFLTHMYSIEYMNGDPHQVRFMSYLSLFTFFMLILVTADNIFQLFLGWEGVGICSYLLINFWFTRISANKSAIMAIVTNKIGDLALMVAFTIIFLVFKSFDYSIIFGCISNLSFYNILEIEYLYGIEKNKYFVYGIQWLIENNINIKNIIDMNTAICYLLIIAAVGKSAQVGLHIWLPEAMEGPTPVSSLIHAATMVTAGIFLIIRCSFLFEFVPNTLLWVIMLGSITSFFASSVGVFQNDLKKVIAYSTCSQLGYMFMSCGFSAYSNGLFHLFNHAFFKALLFLTAGYVIHAFGNEQDMRKMGGLIKLLPMSYLMILIGSLALMGFPFLSGFYSKEKILELFYNRYSISLNEINYNLQTIYFFQLLSTLAVIFTICYSMKLMNLTFFNIQNGYISRMFYLIFNKNKWTYHYNIHYASLLILIPLFSLSYLSITSGYLFQDMMIGVGSDFWKSSMYNSGSYTNPYLIEKYSSNYELINNVLFNFEFNKYIRRITMVWAFYFMVFFFILFYTFKKTVLSISLSWTWAINIFHILTEKYIFYNKLIIEPLTFKMLDFALNVSYKTFDKGLIEFFGPFGITKFISNKMFNYNKYQSSFIFHIINIMIVFILLFIQIIFFIY
jgi:NADH-ubiquinone oxidoreductase chain 5